MGQALRAAARSFGFVIWGLLISISLVTMVTGIAALILIGLVLVAVAMLFAAFLGPILGSLGWTNNEARLVAESPRPDVEANERLEPFLLGGSVMRITRLRLGLAEWGILAGVAALIAAEAVAVIGGFGPIFAVVALGYFLVLGVIYWLYRKETTHRANQASARASTTSPVSDP